jgi:hypothetical protein
MTMMKRISIEQTGRPFAPPVKTIQGAAALFCAAATLTVQAAHDNHIPDLPSVCDRIAVSEDNQVVLHVFAAGVQIYRWD